MPDLTVSRARQRLRCILSPLSLLPVISACASSAPPVNEPAPAPAMPEKVAMDAPALEPEPEPSFCQGGATEYRRRAYTWCAKDGTPHGKFIARYDGGVPELEGQFEAGAMEGSWSSFHRNGQKRWSVLMRQNEEHGKLEGWYPDGTPHYVIPYEGGKRQGAATYYHPNGQKAAEVRYKGNEPLGEWTYWHPSGEKAHQYTHKKKGKTSIHRHWSEAGRKIEAPVGQMPKSRAYSVLEPVGDEVVRCYQHARVFDKSSGKIVAQLVVGYSGEISEVQIFSDDFSHPFMGMCSRRIIESLQFPDNPWGPQKMIRTWELAVQ